MRMRKLFVIVTCAALYGGCATAPQELVDAREAYQRASAGPASKVALAELHDASQALDQAEQSFSEGADPYRTQDLAYIAKRRSELAEVSASTIMEQQRQAQASSDYQDEQGRIVDETRQDLQRTRTVLAESKHRSEMTAQQLAAEKQGRTAAEQKAVDAQTALATSERNSAVTAQQLATEQAARIAAEQRATDAQAALAKLAAVKEDARGMVITLSGSVLFASNQSILLPAAQARLDQVAAVLLTTRERNLTVEGYTDSRGSEGSNLKLSKRRANSVRDYLVHRGYEADRITANGLGESSPIASNANAEGRANNRRVEIIVARDSLSSNQ